MVYCISDGTYDGDSNSVPSDNEAEKKIVGTGLQNFRSDNMDMDKVDAFGGNTKPVLSFPFVDTLGKDFQSDVFSLGVPTYG